VEHVDELRRALNMPQDLRFALAGGVLIGISATVMLITLGRITGISGIFAGCLQPKSDGAWRYLFVLGLVLGPVIYHPLSGTLAPLPNEAGWPLTVMSGLLVGFGTRMGGGCTSGHGVCGIGRLSLRSIVGTVVFIGAGMLTVFLVRHGGS
jgi:uncharacterized membrane protein YedE/YeeE